MEILHWERKAEPSSVQVSACLPSSTPRTSSRSAKNGGRAQLAAPPPLPSRTRRTGAARRGWQCQLTAALRAKTPDTPRFSPSHTGGINHFSVFPSSGDHDRWSFSRPRTPWQGMLGLAPLGFICYYFSSLHFLTEVLFLRPRYAAQPLEGDAGGRFPLSSQEKNNI